MSAGSGYAITAYTINSDGSLTKRASRQGNNTYDAELSPDGTQLVATNYNNGYGVARYDTATLSPNGVYTTGPYPSAVAWSPDGSKFAGVMDPLSTGSPVQVFSAATGAALVTATPAGSASYSALAHEAAWSADGRYLYSLAQDYSGPATLVVTPVAGQAKASVTVSVTGPAAYGRNTTVTVRTPGRPRTAVRLTAKLATGTTATTSVLTDAAGTARWTFAGRASGTVTAFTAGTLTHQAASATARFTAPSAVTTKLSGYSRVSGGVAHYSSIGAVEASLTLLPQRYGKLTVTLQHRSGSSWKTDQTAVFTTDGAGRSWVGLSRGNRKMTYRFQVRAVADSAATTSPTATTQSFMVD